MRPLTATVDLGALRHNLGVARRCAPHSRMLAVVKANAYGHGLMRAARALAGADGLALVELDGAVRLREAGYAQRIVLLEGYFEAQELAEFAAHGLSAVVHNQDQISMLRTLAPGANLDVLLKVNTGMNRLGIAPADCSAALGALRANPGVGPISVLTHFADADDARGVAWQLERLAAIPEAQGLPLSFANSAAILRYPESHADWIRPGIMLYGCSPFPERIGAENGLRPAMVLESRIIAIQQVAANERVGYGGIFTAARPMRIGVVACGYADGYPRHAPNGTPVVVEGRPTGTVGRVSMDMLCVDLGGVPEAHIGSRVVLWGAENPIETVAAAAGTVGYELMCALAPRVSVVERD
ncbi:MAG TPA: alanine racemase [Burkholderiales bacterium]|nr:alanine racemase [Burkholderiales bacterium]